jgi:hypothetical protein
MDFVSDHPSTSLREHRFGADTSGRPWTPEGTGRFFLFGWLGVFFGVPIAWIALVLLLSLTDSLPGAG